MNRTASKVVGVIAIILSLLSAVLAAFYWLGVVVDQRPRTLHGLALAAIFVILMLFGIMSLRSRGTSAGDGSEK
jgi:hypothetical protein